MSLSLALLRVKRWRKYAVCKLQVFITILNVIKTTLRLLTKQIFIKGNHGEGEDVSQIWAWRPSWSCDFDHLYKLLFPIPKKAPHKIWRLIGQALSEKKTFENGERQRRRRRRRTPGFGILYQAFGSINGQNGACV